MQLNDIVNRALLNLGSALSIQDLSTDQSNQARIIRRFIDQSLTAVLEKHPWHFATTSQALPLLGEDLNAAWRFTYSLPVDCLVLRELAPNGRFSKYALLEQNKNQWEEEYSTGAAKINSNIPNAHGKYTVKMDYNNQFPDHFGRAFAAQIAMDIAPALLSDKAGRVLDSLAVKLDDKIWMEVANDEGRAPQKLDVPNIYIQSRHSC